MKEYTHYNRIKSVLAEKNKTGTWLSEQMGRNLGTVSRWMTNRSALWDACQSKKVQPSVEPLGFAACQSKNSTRLLVTSMWM